MKFHLRLGAILLTVPVLAAPLAAQTVTLTNQTLATSGSIAGSMVVQSLFATGTSTLQATGNLALGGSASVAPGTLTLDTNSYTITVEIDPGGTSLSTNTATIIKTGAGSLVLNGKITGSFSAIAGSVTTPRISGSTSLTGATLTTSNIVAGGVTLNAGSTLKAGTTFSVASSDSGSLITLNGSDAAIDTNGFILTYDRSIIGPGSLTKNGAGTLSLGRNQLLFRKRDRERRHAAVEQRGRTRDG